MGVAAQAMRGIEAIRKMDILMNERITKLKALRKLAPGPSKGCIHCGKMTAEKRLVKQFVDYEIKIVREQYAK